MALYVGADESHAWYVLTVVTSPLRMRPGVTWHCYGLSRRVVPHWPCVLYVVRRVWFSSVSHELPVCLFRSPRRHLVAQPQKPIAWHSRFPDIYGRKRLLKGTVFVSMVLRWYVNKCDYAVFITLFFGSRNCFCWMSVGISFRAVIAPWLKVSWWRANEYVC